MTTVMEEAKFCMPVVRTMSISFAPVSIVIRISIFVQKRHVTFMILAPRCFIHCIDALYTKFEIIIDDQKIFYTDVLRSALLVISSDEK